jgi:glycosyltransferase involved in cell wall biosynthesis
MKILHLITRLDPGGSAENTLLTCHHLTENGWQAQLASGPGWTGKEANVGNARVPVLLIPAMQRDPSPLADAIAFWQIYRLLRRERPTILHTHSAKAGVLGRWAGFVARVPVIVHTPHGHVLYGYARGLTNWLYLVAERFCARISHCLVALSEGEKRESAAAGIGKPGKWVVIPSGVDVARVAARPAQSAGHAVRIGTVARLEHVKGIDVLVHAAASLVGSAASLPSAAAAMPAGHEPGAYEILVWGDGEQRAPLIRLAAQLGVADHVRFVGTDQPVQDFLRELDIYVQPSRNEGMGRALVLAQAVGLPVVASNVCGIPDVVQDGETGLLVAAEDPEALSTAIGRLVRAVDMRNAFGTAARSWIMAKDESGYPKFSTAAMLWRLEALYRRLADRE